jgi:ferredoxin/flavodoxin---NADP+ reductase
MQGLEALWAAPRHAVVICGGAVSGSEAARVCAERGMLAVVIEQNARPYGKIEDGLPRWHDKLRAQECARIDESLTQPGVLFVPSTVVGRDVALGDFNASAVLLANGAWRDRPLPVPGAEAFVGRGLVYQNPFVYWFNHYEEPGYQGPHFDVRPGAMIVGGGLASVDVAKVVNLVLFRRALAERGIDVSVVELEHQGIPKLLAAHGLSVEALGIEGATIYYRRRVRDMPVASPKDDSAEQRAKVEGVREKLVSVLAQKYLVRVADCRVPVGLVVEDERLVGLRFRRSELRDGKLVELEGSEHEVRSDFIVSSIGSVPEALATIPMKGELYDFADWTTGQVRGLSGVYGLGNVLTGQGNIKDSRHSAQAVSAHVIAQFESTPPLGPEALRALCERVQARWAAVGYGGDYRAWIAAHPAH